MSDQVVQTQDFGLKWIDGKIQFKVWAPCAQKVTLAVYKEGDDFVREEFSMKGDAQNIFTTCLPSSYENWFYTYSLIAEDTSYEVVDPYAVASAVNSQKAMIVHLEATNPKGWENHIRPEPIPAQEAIIYEIHVRDFSISENSGMKNKGKYKAFTEMGTKYQNIKTGVDHLKELGVTHVHLMPIYDFATVDETQSHEYNWGYDPVLYNCPEGSYATNPYDGRVRIREVKEMIMALHEAGIRVILDVVYNHTFQVKHSNFNRLAPGHFYRRTDQGEFANGSGVGNELATEHPLVRKYIIDSLLFWLEEYQVDGFRFDLLALYDKKTVRDIVEAVHEKRPDAILYGEPWIGWESVLPENERFLKSAQRGLDIALFNDDFRNAIKGDNDGEKPGFVMGSHEEKPWVELGIVASTALPDGRYGYADRAAEVVNYVSSHDNLVLWDKISKSMKQESEEIKKKMHRLALSIVFTSFGISFLQGGTEFLRTKKGNANSYNAKDEVNQIDWKQKKEHEDHFCYIRDLIAFRKDSGAFSFNTKNDIEKNVSFLAMPDGVIGYQTTTKDKRLCIVVHSGRADEVEVAIPQGCYNQVANHENVDLSKTRLVEIKKSKTIKIPSYSTLILVKTKK